MQNLFPVHLDNKGKYEYIIELFGEFHEFEKANPTLECQASSGGFSKLMNSQILHFENKKITDFLKNNSIEEELYSLIRKCCIIMDEYFLFTWNKRAKQITDEWIFAINLLRNNKLGYSIRYNDRNRDITLLFNSDLLPTMQQQLACKAVGFHFTINKSKYLD